MYLLYNLILAIAFVILSPRFAFDAITKGKYAKGFWQRFGYLPAIVNRNEPIIWLHCVSVGETNAAQPLIRKILENFPQHQIVVSTTTRTGQNLAQELFKNDVAMVFYFPFDFRFAVRRVLKHIKPQAVLIMETEIWFNFLRECRKRSIKIALINGRLSPTSFRNYKLIRGFMSEVLTNLDLALMQSESDANRILQLGIAPEKVIVTGNVKFDLSFDANETQLTQQFRERFDFKTPLIIAASTHEPEEKWIVEAFKKICVDFPNDKPRLLIAPRHPERFGAVEGLLKNSGVKFAKRSNEIAVDDKNAEIILLDSIGELKSVYSLAEIVFVGGSLMTKGGHNVLEPIAARKCVVTGFYTANFAAIVKTLLDENALVQLPETNDDEQIIENLRVTFLELLNDNERRKNLANNAFEVLQTNRGATDATILQIKSLLR